MIFFPLLASCNEEPYRDPVRLSTNNWIGFEPFFIAETVSLYDPGTVHLVETPATSGLSQAFKSATVDAGPASLSRALYWSASGVEITILMVVDVSHGEDVIVARPDIQSVSDLKGKRVGAELNSLNGFLLLRALEKVGLSLSDIDVVDAVNQQLSNLYESGEIDAAATYGWPYEEIKSLGGQKIFTSADIPGEISDILVVRTQYLKANPDRVQEIIEGWIRARRLVADWPDDKILPQGARKAPITKSEINGVKWLSVEENLALLSNGAQGMQEIIDKTYQISLQLGLLQAGSEIPNVDPEPFLNALDAVNKERRS